MNTANLPSSKSSKAIKTIKLVVFSVGNLNFAFNIDVVQKVINYAAMVSSGLNHFGLVNIGDRQITVIDLHRKLFNVSQSEDVDNLKYLILVRNSADELFGIIVNEAPSLLDIELENIRIIPPSYRNSDTLRIASHVTIILTEKGEETTFLLDPDDVIK